MAARAFPYGKIRIHAEPDPCKDIFEDLKHSFQNSHEIGLQDLPTKDDLSWAIQKCPNSIDDLADILGLTKKDEHFETSMGAIGPRQLVAPVYEWFEPTQSSTTAIPTSTASPSIARPIITMTTTLESFTTITATPTALPTSAITLPTNIPSTRRNPTLAEAGVAFAILIGIFLVIAGIILACVSWKRATINRKVAAEARAKRALSPGQVSRAEAFVRSQWAEIDNRKQQRENGEAIELQEISVQSYGTVDEIVEPREVYRHPRMDWE